MTEGNGFSERLRRVERVLAGEEPVSQKQATLLVLDLVAQTYEQTAASRASTKKVRELAEHNKDKIEALEIRVATGIGLTVLVGIMAGLKLLVGI